MPLVVYKYAASDMHSRPTQVYAVLHIQNHIKISLLASI